MWCLVSRGWGKNTKPWWFVSLCFFVRPLTNTNGTYSLSTSWPNPRWTVLNLTKGSSVTAGELIRNLVSAHSKYICVNFHLILHFEVGISVSTDFSVNWSQCQRPWKHPIFEGVFFEKLSLLRRLPLESFLRWCHYLFQFIQTERVERWRRTEGESFLRLEVVLEGFVGKLEKCRLVLSQASLRCQIQCCIFHITNIQFFHFFSLPHSDMWWCYRIM